MSLRLVLGNSGSGKSCYLYQHIIEAAVRSPKKKFLVIVPEQFTMQTQRELVRLHPDRGLFNIDVLSFPRLAHRIFEEVGAPSRAVLEEMGKTLLLRRAASKKEPELKALKNNFKKVGYLRQMKSMISELTQYDIDRDKMERLLEAAKRPSLYYKLKDISLLYHAFREELEGRYITAEETLEALCQVARSSAILDGCVAAFDGFTGFTPVQYKLLRELLPLASEVYVTVTIDVREDVYRIRGEHELFYLSKKTIHTLIKTAKECACETADPVVLEQQPRFRESRELAFLERSLFRPGRQPVFSEENGGVSLHAAANPIEEAHFAARTIQSLVRRGYRYQDIAVIVGDLPSYANYIPQVFGEYQIPLFMDSTRTVFSNPLVEFVRAALDMVQQNYTYASVFRYLRCGLCRLEKAQTDLLENYVLAAGIRGFSQWIKPFERKPDHFSEEALVACEELRAGIMEPLEAFTKSVRLKSTTAREKTERLYQLLCHYEIQRQLAAYEKRFRQNGQAELQKEFAGIYAILIQLLDKLVELLGEEPLSLEEYTQLLEAGLEEARVRMIPPSLDRIQVGDLERTRLQNIKVLLFLGLNDGWVPSSGQGGGLLSDMERESLMGCGVELAPTQRQNSYIQKFYLYLNLTKPQEALYLSYSKASADGSPLRPSYVVRAVQRLFPDLPVVDEDRYQRLTERIFTPQNGLSYLIGGLQTIRETPPDPQWMELYNWYRRADEKTVRRLVQAAFLTFDGRGIGRLAARELYGEVLMNSVARLEKFASCAFAHFLQYGLRLEEREEYAFHPVDAGRIFHSAIELYSREMDRRNYDWRTIPDKERESLIEHCVDQVAGEYGQHILHDGARNQSVLRRMKRIMSRTVWALHRQIASGSFYPAAFEVYFSQAEDLEAINIDLTADEKMRLQGRIDRIDICRRDDQIYVKVIDYKSGNTSFDLAALYHGLQLQLVVYLNAALEMEQRIHPDQTIVPAGIFYCRMKDPLLDTQEEPAREELDRMLLRELRPDGLINQERPVFCAMDQHLEKSSDVIPLSVNKDGTPSKNSKTATPKQFADLSSFVRRKMQELGQRMMEGEAAPVPYERKQQTGCDYCIYKTVCGFDPRIPGARTNRLAEYSEEEIWKRLGGDAL